MLVLDGIVSYSYRRKPMRRDLFVPARTLIEANLLTGMFRSLASQRPLCTNAGVTYGLSRQRS